MSQIPTGIRNVCSFFWSSTSIKTFLTFSFLLLLSAVQAQNTLKGTISDRTTGETLVGANVSIKGTTEGTSTDIDGNFELITEKSFPITLSVFYVGYANLEYTVNSASDKIKIKLITENFELEAFEVNETRISDKQKESPLTVESMDVLAIKETPAPSFYEGLGTLKGVDLTSASIGFKVINTRGFNSTSPVRSLQLIDGMDNQAPGLNFSLGNFLGASDIDVMKVELIQGASSAFYGPSAFNGVINIQTKDPFLFQGVTVSAKAGERNLREVAVRYATSFWKRDSVDRMAFKVNGFFLQADDWEARNADAVFESESARSNPGGYDAVNRYGDENPIFFNSPNSQISRPGLNVFHRDGYWEEDLVDYDTENIKASAQLHYKFNENERLILASNFGTGTTVYHGDNRFSLKDILFFQNRLEYQGKKGFIRAYATNEDAGNSYDAVLTAILLQDSAKDAGRFASDYAGYYAQNIAPQITSLPNWPTPVINPGPPVTFEYDFDLANSILAQYGQELIDWHQEARDVANRGESIGGIVFNENVDRFEPGTDRFNAAFNSIISRTSFEEGGSRFFDRSALYHIQGERQIITDSIGNLKGFDLRAGASGRLYAPNSRGTIFIDSAGTRITNWETGAYVGAEKRLLDDKLKVNATIRVDKNENFPVVASPALSAVYKTDEKSVIRLSFSSAIRNPTLQDQFLNFNVGRATLLGNLNGFDSLVTIESAQQLAREQDPTVLDYFNVAPVIQEKVRTIEAGYRTTLGERLYLDASYYFSFYKDFIGFNIAVDPVIDPNTNLLNPSRTRVIRIAANAQDVVTTQGFDLGLNYFFKKFISLNGNYSFNQLNLQGSDDPIIPAFNTPEHKFNIGISGRDINTYFKFSKKEDARTFGLRNFGFNINYKWVEGFIFEGSPQFTGEVPTYDMVDAQINKYFPKIKSTFKLGASNLLNNKRFQVYGGPRIGRMAYISILVEPDRKN